MAITQNLVIRQGEDFSFSFDARHDGAALDITGFTIESQIRRRANSEDTVEEFDCSIVDAVAGVFLLSMPSVRTEDIPAGRTKYDWKSKYVYDVKLTSPEGNVYKPVKGHVLIDPSVTR